jgi:hypothetical protein
MKSQPALSFVDGLQMRPTSAAQADKMLSPEVPMSLAITRFSRHCAVPLFGPDAHSVF